MNLQLEGISGLVTTNQAAAIYGVSGEAIRQRIARYRLPFFTVSGRYKLVRLSDIQASYQRNVHGVLEVEGDTA